MRSGTLQQTDAHEDARKIERRLCQTSRSMCLPTARVLSVEKRRLGRWPLCYDNNRALSDFAPLNNRRRLRLFLPPPQGQSRLPRQTGLSALTAVPTVKSMPVR
jgi:hypothetical protein